MKKLMSLLVLTLLILVLTACGDTAADATQVSFTSQQQVAVEDVAASVDAQDAAVPVSTITVEYDSEDLEASTSEAVGTTIELNGDAVSVSGEGATVNGSVVTITSAGTYTISGTLNDGQVRVETADEDTVRLILNGVTITNSTSAPVYVSNAEKVVITLAEGSQNTVTDGTSYIFEDEETDEPNAALFSKDDLTINDSGSLTVNANYNNGIASKDDLKITGGTITVYAVNDGVKGRDSVAILDGVITVQAGSDGIQANNDEDTEKGYVSIEGGTINVTAGLDGIQAETNLMVGGGEITVVTGGGSGEVSNTDAGWNDQRGGGNAFDELDDSESTKGLKAGVLVSISGGSIYVDATDDAVHSNNSLTVDGGTLLLASGDDGLHADASLEINGGEITITQSYEGIESTAIIINDGIIRLASSDDGINVANGSTGGGWQRPESTVSGSLYLQINGGYIYINAYGDGVDANGTVDMTGGVVVVSGPVNSGNGALDYMGSFNISGGFLVAAGSTGMAQAPSASSTQYSVMQNFQSTQAAGMIVHIESASGEEILTFAPTKEYQSIVVSSPDLVNGETYTVYTGGSSTGSAVDGLYSAGEYSGGTQVSSFTVSSIVTGAGSTSGMAPGGGRGGNRPGGGGGQP